MAFSTDSQSNNSESEPQMAKVTAPEEPQHGETNVESAKSQQYKCEFCEECFRRKDSHDRHRFTHTGVYEYVCSEPGCGKQYTNRSHLKRHIRANHTRPLAVLTPSTIECEDASCTLKFHTKLAMKRHYQTKHVVGKPHACDQCEERFWRKSQLRVHKFKHTDQYPHRCEHCKNGFVNLKSMRNHRCNSNLRPCPDCSKEFKLWSELVAHRRLEHPNRFRCEHCSKVFHTKRCLKAHARSHVTDDEQEMFECPHDGCPRFYKHERNLYAHVRSKHEGTKKFVCEEEGCGRVLSTRQKLEHHLKLHQCAARSVQRVEPADAELADETPTLSDQFPEVVTAEEAIVEKLSNVNASEVEETSFSSSMPKAVSGMKPKKSKVPQLAEQFFADSTSESETESGSHAANILSSNVLTIKKQLEALRNKTSRV
ncbi:transcription factor IIIA [Anopheles darlingi]|uniref:transcription factor IIIA n=1 Tax=Anopheles darlingi TaxID=43151 RepID=UPI0020FFFB18|nr:transcription factor IIIA [Anopheles darlingi]